MNNNFEFDPFLALKSIIEVTTPHFGNDFIKITANELKKLFKADLVFITHAIDYNPTTKVKVLYTTNTNIPEMIDLDGIPGKFVFENKIIRITENVQYNFLNSIDIKLQSFYGIPITNKENKCIGHIAIYSKEIRDLPTELNDIAMIFSRKIELELNKIELEEENHKIKKQLEELVITDTLTELYNRRYFQQICSNIFAQVKRDNINATLAYIDIDDFKSINDKFGHQGGDEVLKNFGDILKNETRKGVDYIFRLGGEEFCIISINTPIEYSYEHLRRIMKKTKSHFEKSKFGEITLSIGLIEFIEEYKDCNELINLADKKMYEAKKAGKNTIIK